MRSVFLLLCVAGAALAQDPFAEGLKHLHAARESVFSTGGRAEVFPAIRSFVQLADARCAKPLAEFLVATMEGERKLIKRIQEIEVEIVKASDRIEAIDRELALLRRRVDSGATNLGPVIGERKAERERHERAYYRGREEMARYSVQVGLVREARETLADGLIEVLSGLKEKEPKRTGFVALRDTLDPVDPQQSLFLIRILRESALPGAPEVLIAILGNKKSTAAARGRAMSALAKICDPDGVDALLALWEKDPDGDGKRVRVLLGLAAKRELKSLEDARAWAGTLRR